MPTKTKAKPKSKPKPKPKTRTGPAARPDQSDAGAVGTAIRNERLRKNLGLADAAARCGMAGPNLVRVELYQDQTRFTTVRHIIQALDLPLEVFFAEGPILRAAARIAAARKSPAPADAK